MFDHYERLLAPIYTWMTGGDDGLATSRALLGQLGVLEVRGEGRAHDLGAGSGLQTLPLAEAGWRVRAIDLSPTLVAELRERARARGVAERVDVVQGDLVEDLTAPRRRGVPSELVLCMGDTLTHLDSRDEVRRMIDGAAASLVEGGRLVLGWRDLTVLPEGDARFFVVRSDAARTLTCFLEAIDDDRVRVHDLVHVGGTLTVSSYQKLRLAPALVDAWLAEAGLVAERAEVVRGMVLRVARK